MEGLWGAARVFLEGWEGERWSGKAGGGLGLHVRAEGLEKEGKKHRNRSKLGPESMDRQLNALKVKTLWVPELKLISVTVSAVFCVAVFSSCWRSSKHHCWVKQEGVGMGKSEELRATHHTARPGTVGLWPGHHGSLASPCGEPLRAPAEAGAERGAGSRGRARSLWAAERNAGRREGCGAASGRRPAGGAAVPVRGGAGRGEGRDAPPSLRW